MAAVQMTDVVTVALTAEFSTTLDRRDYERLFVPDEMGVPTVRWGVRVAKSGVVHVIRGGRRRNGTHGVIYLHREVVEAPDDIKIDHRDTNGLNNTRANLRTATASQNAANQRKTRGTSRYKGVYKPRRGGWVAQIGAGRRHFYLGSFATEEDAARAYDRAAVALFGEYARPNDLGRVA